MTDILTKGFLDTLNSNTNPLAGFGFSPYSYEEKGLAHFVKFKKNKSSVEFMFGPPEFQVEMIIYTDKGQFAFRDLLKNSQIAAWVANNRYVQTGDRSVRNEVLWFIHLLTFSLPYVE